MVKADEIKCRNSHGVHTDTPESNGHYFTNSILK